MDMMLGILLNSILSNKKQILKDLDYPSEKNSTGKNPLWRATWSQNHVDTGKFVLFRQPLEEVANAILLRKI